MASTDAASRSSSGRMSVRMCSYTNGASWRMRGSCSLHYANISTRVCRTRDVSIGKSLIINSPYSVPTHHWVDDGVRFNLVEGILPASYEIFDPVKGTRRSEELGLVNQIRERVDEWRLQGYPNVTTVTRELPGYNGCWPRQAYACSRRNVAFNVSDHITKRS